MISSICPTVVTFASQLNLHDVRKHGLNYAHMDQLIDVLTPLFRLTLRIILPAFVLLGTGCNVARTAHRPFNNHYNAEFALRQDIIQDAAGYIGSKYKYTGTSPSTGFDCSGFTSFIMGKYGIQLPHQSASQAVTGKSIPVNKVQPGDLVYFSRKGRIFHVAIVETNDDNGIVVIHSTTSRGVIRENITQSDYWRPKITGARTVIELQDTAAN